MSPLVGETGSSQDERIGSAEDDYLERRLWVRFIIPLVRARVTWKCGDQEAYHLVKLENVSPTGAAVVMDVVPLACDSLKIGIEMEGETSGPIAARLVAFSSTEGGKVLVQLQFELNERLRKMVPHLKERRTWRRIEVSESHAGLLWYEDETSQTVPAVLKDLSGGGAAVLVDSHPPAGRSIWLYAEADGRRTTPAESTMVGCDLLRSGLYQARLAFLGLCPYDLFRSATGHPL